MESQRSPLVRRCGASRSLEFFLKGVERLARFAAQGVVERLLLAQRFEQAAVVGFPFVGPEDAAALREAMHRLQDSPGLAAQMGGAARRRFEERMVDAGDGRLRSDPADGAPRNP